MTLPPPPQAFGDIQPLYTANDPLQQLTIPAEQLEAKNIFGFATADTRARPFKLLRTQVVRRAASTGMKIIGVTSSSPGVGKSFVASNLAAALSRIADVDVCLIDLDLHRPALGPRFGLDDRPGIHDFLSGAVGSIHEVAHRVNDERLVVIPGFQRKVATGELLTSDRAEQLFNGLRALPLSTLVLVDMPPIFADDDAVIIGSKIDGYLLVVEEGRTTRKQVRETIRMMQPAPFIGSILNRYRQQLFTDDYGYGRSYGYGAYY